ncbi:MAG: hypothetical protein IJS73_08205, partial [Paludibacteraceae bacterium]|nr:hypothetical protein [Paludibacteraceae bacterium]
LGEQQIPFSIVFTKIDKLSKQQLQDNLDVYKQQLSEQWEELPPLFLTSSEKNIGAEEIIQYIESISELTLILTPPHSDVPPSF